jgi:hypothetical protein
MTEHIVENKCGCLKHLKEKIAGITVNPETRQILDIHLYERNLRFKCKRCAVYCCKLGGPSLTKKDIEQIESTGHDISEFIEPTKKQYGNFPPMLSTIKSNKDGSCIFLRIDKKKNTYKCSIYDARPVLCRLYPFDFERDSENSFLLRIIPCCKGLNNTDGESVNESFIVKQLLESIYAIL